jgi:hemoglobin/transferrin/lactoferrin receptor protein
VFGRELRTIIYLFATLLCSFYAHNQEITVIDELTRQSIPDVKVTCENHTVKVKTNSEGRFRLEPFKSCDSIYLNYSLYSEAGYTVEELKDVTTIEMSEEAISINPTTVTASRWEKELIEEPSHIVRLDLRKLQLYGSQTTADMLESSGFVFIQKSQLAGGSPQLRGFGTNRVLIAIDGVRMNNAIFRSGNLQNVISLDANNMESAEVLFGPGAVMYGSDAIGGVMDFHSRKAKFTPDSLKSHSKANVLTRYSTANNEITAHFDFNIGGKKWASLTSATYSRFGNLKAGKYGNSQFLRPTYQGQLNGMDTTFVNPDPQVQIQSEYSQLNLSQRLAYQANEELLIEFDGYYSTTSNAPRYDRLLLDQDENDQLDYAEWFYGPQQWIMGRVGLVHSSKDSTTYDHMRVTLAVQNFKESRHDRRINNTSMRRQYENVDAFSANIDFDKKFGARFELLYGAEAIYNIVGSNAYREDINSLVELPINSRYPDGSTWASAGAYGKGKWYMSEKWILTGAARYSQYSIKARFDTLLFAYPLSETSSSNGSLNGSVGIVYVPNKKSQYYMNFSSGFRAPNIDDLGKVFDSEPGKVIVPNPDLKPETAYNAEIGFLKSIKGVVKLDGAFYFTYLENALARSSFELDGQDSIFYEGSLSQVQAVQNLSRAYIHGLQGGVEIVLPKGLSLYSKVSWQQGFEYYLDSMAFFPKSHVAPLFGLGIR